MSKKIFVVGTGTDIGKTYITALIIKKMQENRVNVAYFKAAMSGNILNNNEIIPLDSTYVKKISKLKQELTTMCPYVYLNEYSPHLAGNIEGNKADLENIIRTFNKLEIEYDYVTIEGAGGIVCPLSEGDILLMQEDFIKEINACCILVADAGLGTINNTVLTINYMRNKNIKIKGIILNRFQSNNIVHIDNYRICEKLSKVPIIAVVADNEDDLQIDINKLKSLYD